jgi:hypothetical protein
LEPRPSLSHSNERDLGPVLKGKTGPAPHALWDQEESHEIERLQLRVYLGSDALARM